MKILKKLSLSAVGLAVLLSFPAAAQNDGQQKSFDGQISSYDESARTLKVGGETYQVLPTTRITDANARSTPQAIANGQKVQGTYKESAEGKREVITLNITEKANTALGSAQDTTTSESGASFQGRVDRLDRNARTLTINGQTYQVLPTTRIAGKRGASADLSNLKNNQRVEGTYKQSAEGKREVLTLEIGQDEATPASAQTFQGRVDRVDPNTQTFTINNQTYQLLQTTRITGAQGTPVAASALNRNERVSGTYKESAEGKREVITLDIGAK
jgi:ribosome maturation factor RimP